MELSSLKLKTLLIFHEEIFQAQKMKKNLLYFLKESFSYISGNGTF